MTPVPGYLSSLIWLVLTKIAYICFIGETLKIISWLLISQQDSHQLFTDVIFNKTISCILI